MLIAVNTRLLQKGKLEGIGWFTRETLSRITQNHPEHQFLFLFDRPYADEFIFSDNVTPLVVSPPTRHPLLWYIWFEWMIPRVLKEHNADLFLSPDGYLSLSTKVKQLPVIHDINFAHRPQDLPWLMAKYYNFFFPKFAKRARRIATVSNYSKADISQTYQINPDLIDVVSNGVNERYQPTSEEEKVLARQKFASGSPYFLYIGSQHPRKNIDGLLRAYEAFRMVGSPEVKLVIAGSKLFKTSEIRKTLERMRFKPDVIFTGRLSVEDLHQLLGGALALTFVSIFEGFGIPVLEAMHAGVPVICSNTSALPEVGGEAALYVDPFDEEQIASAMQQMASDKNLRAELIAKGHVQQQKFSWDQTASRLWESIQQCLID
jgi:glycosyltransferase involved in cell wall biosynthesis